MRMPMNKYRPKTGYGKSISTNNWMATPATELLLCRRYNLVAKENQRIARADYMPIILFYSLLAEYMENAITKEKLITSIKQSTKYLTHNKYRSHKVMELLDELAREIPAEIKTVKKMLETSA
jgi:UDP-galactopyranose mutase